MPSTNPLSPIIPDNARPPRLTAAAGTRLAGASFPIKIIIFIGEIILQPINKYLIYLSFLFSSFTQYYWIELSLIVQNPSLLAIKPGPYLSTSVADHPLRSTKDLWLGRLLFYQQPNLARAYLKTVKPFLL